MSATRTDALYVKLKENSIFTVNRERVDSIANYLQQDITFVTHFALARLYDDITSGKLKSPSDIPLAADWLTTEEVDAVRADVKARFGTPQIKWDPNPMLDSLLPQT